MKAEDIVRVMQGMGIARSCIKQSNEWVAAPCPLAPWTHAKGRDRSASFGISITEDGRSGYNCLSCKEHGNVVGLLDRLEDLTGNDYSDLIAEVEELEAFVAIPPWETPIRKAKVLPEPWDEEAFDETFDPAIDVPEARRYFRSRDLLLSSMERFDLRWDAYRRRILFKVKREGLLYGASGRSVNPRAKHKVKIYDHHSSLFLLGEEHVEPDLPTVVIEGLMGLPELDSCNLFDYANAVALQGSKLSIEQRDRLVELGNPVVLLFDPDKSGRDGLLGIKTAKGRSPGAFELLKGLADVRVAHWPEGITDLSQLTERETYRMVVKTASFNPWKPD
jgi:hypothetical protein